MNQERNLDSVCIEGKVSSETNKYSKQMCWGCDGWGEKKDTIILKKKKKNTTLHILL